MLLICGCPAHHYRRRLLQAVPSNLATLSILSALCRVPGWVCGLSGLCPVSVSLIPSSFCVAKITMTSGKRDDASIWASCCLRVIFPAFFSSYLLFSFFLHLFLCLSVCVSDILNISQSMGRCQIFCCYLFLLLFGLLQIALIYIILRTIRRIVFSYFPLVSLLLLLGVCIFFDSCQEVISWNFTRRRLVSFCHWQFPQPATKKRKKEIPNEKKLDAKIAADILQMSMVPLEDKGWHGGVM